MYAGFTGNTADNQEVLNFVVGGLRTQGCKALDAGNCKYRGENGTKCAVGLLIPDSEYKTDFEGQAVTPCKVISNNDITKYVMGKGYDPRLLEDLQSIHDVRRVADWEDGFLEISQKHGLTFPSRYPTDAVAV